MKIAVISGKGGTGKTFVSTHLASVIPNSTYVDCDIEEPNGHLFYKAKTKESKPVYVNKPIFENRKCIGCQECVKFCKFNALAFVIDQVYLFDELCHSCLGCQIICNNDAVKIHKKEIGRIYSWEVDDIKILSGQLNIGETTGVKIIQDLIERVDPIDETIIDGPPGSGCEVMDTVKESDYVLIVAEPTTFGMHNFMMVYEMATLFDKNIGVIINKAEKEKSQVEKYCIANNINILHKIEFDIQIAKRLSEGEIITSMSKYKEQFEKIYQSIKDEAAYEKNSSA